MDRQFIQLKNVLARNVRSRRKELELSQEEIAFDAGIDRTYISQIERSTINPSLLVLCKLANALKTEVPTLLMETEQTG
ncbi:MAG: helix-turn-helix transcriptional regulator [Gallionella sp.]|nr:helix-turn-helix transcriptional regulator [Gallionella sp.]